MEMDEITQFLRSMTPGQIEQAVRLLQRHTTANQWGAAEERRQSGEGGSTCPQSRSAGDFQTPAEEYGLEGRTPLATDNVVSSAVALALRHAVAAENNNCNAADGADGKNKNRNGGGGDDDDDDDDDIPLALCASASSKRARKGNSGRKSAVPERLCSTEECCTPARKGKASSKTPVTTLPSTSAARSLSSFGFVSVTKKTTPAASGTNKLFTPFLQDKRVVPPALRFWCHDDDVLQHQQEHEQVREGQTIILDENSSSLMHPSVTCCGSNRDNVMGDEKQGVQLREGGVWRYSSFAAMMEEVITNTNNNNNNGNYNAALQHCPCRFHVSLPAPRAGFKNEVVFCGFYAIGYDPCQSRPPYFGTYNNQDALNLQELLQLARFDAGGDMPRLSNLEYEYDSGDDWDVVEGDEDLGASSGSDAEDEEDSGDSCLGGSDDEFINDENAEDDEDDSDVELQRRMLEAQQRRVNRLRHKDKLVPAFSGPFVGVAVLDHPLREYDRLERVSCVLDGATFTSVLQQELRAMGGSSSGPPVNTSNSSSTRGALGGSGLVEVEEDEWEQQQQRQRLIAAALRNRREMLEEELDGMHAIIKANSKISPNAIVEAMRQQQWCVGVARAEILRTIRRYYERQHNTLVRRAEPWPVTDERLFAKPSRSKASENKKNSKRSDTNNMNNAGEDKLGRHEEEEEAVSAAAPNADDDDDDDDDDGCGDGDDSEDDMTLLELARKRPRAGDGV